MDGKPAIRRLLVLDDYIEEQELRVYGAWDIVLDQRPHPEEVLARGVIGDEATVTKLAEEAFGSGISRGWLLRPHPMKVKGISAEKILFELRIELK